MSRINKDTGGYKINTNILCVLGFCCMWLVSGLRYFVGADFGLYYNYYLNLYNEYSDYNTRLEIGYLYLNKIISFFAKNIFNEQIIFLVTSFIIIYLIYNYVIKNCKRYELSIFLFISMYFYYTSFNLVRQFIAIAIVFYGSKYIIKREFKTYLLFILVGFLFHKSVLIMIPMYFLSNLKLDLKRYFQISVAGITLYFLFYKIAQIVFIIIPRYSKYNSGELNKFLYEGSHSAHFIILLVISIILIILKDKLIDYDYKNNIYINMVFFGTILQFLGIKSVLVSRVAYYLTIYSIIIIPKILDIQNKKMRPILYIIIVMFFLSTSSILLMLNQANVLPYIYNFPF